MKIWVVDMGVGYILIESMEIHLVEYRCGWSSDSMDNTLHITGNFTRGRDSYNSGVFT